MRKWMLFAIVCFGLFLWDAKNEVLACPAHKEVEMRCMSKPSDACQKDYTKCVLKEKQPEIACQAVFCNQPELYSKTRCMAETPECRGYSIFPNDCKYEPEHETCIKHRYIKYTKIAIGAFAIGIVIWLIGRQKK